VAVGGNLGGGGALTKPRNVRILTRRREGAKGFAVGTLLFACFAASRETIITSPRVVGAGDFRQDCVGEFVVDEVDEGAKFTGVDEEALRLAGMELSPRRMACSR
jgi:hypothetical protein